LTARRRLDGLELGKTVGYFTVISLDPVVKWHVDLLPHCSERPRRMYAVTFGFFVLFVAIVTRVLVISVVLAVATLFGHFVFFFCTTSVLPISSPTATPLEKGFR
jgi:hypothetical protein